MNRFEFMQRYVLAVVSGMARREAEPVPFDELARGARAMHDALSAMSAPAQPVAVLGAVAGMTTSAPVDALNSAALAELGALRAAFADVQSLTACPPGYDLKDHLTTLIARADEALEEARRLRSLAPDSEALVMLRGVLQSLAASHPGGFNAFISHAWVESARVWIEQANTRRTIAEQSKANAA